MEMNARAGIKLELTLFQDQFGGKESQMLVTLLSNRRNTQNLEVKKTCRHSQMIKIKIENANYLALFFLFLLCFEEMFKHIFKYV